MKTLGIDFGTKKVGIAISDETERVAFPYSVLTNMSRLLSDVEAICKKEDITAIVLGESKDFSGKENPVMMKIHAFRKELEKEMPGLPVYFEPEFLSSKQARTIVDGGKKNDASAAAIILQSFLDKKS